jgi:hypothetical protein
MKTRSLSRVLVGRSSTVSVTTTNTGFSLFPDPTNQESINVYLTEPPNDQAVWMIHRTEGSRTRTT